MSVLKSANFLGKLRFNTSKSKRLHLVNRLLLEPEVFIDTKGGSLSKKRLNYINSLRF